MNAATSHPLNHAEWYILIAAAVFTVTLATVFLAGIAVVHITEDRAEALATPSVVAASAQAGTAPNHVPAIPPASLAAHQDAGGTQTRKPVGVEETPAGFRHHAAAGGV